MGLVRQLLIVALLCGLGIAAYRYGWPLIEPGNGNPTAPGRSDASAAGGGRSADRSATVLVQAVGTRVERARVRAVGTARAHRLVTLHPAAAGEVAALHFAPAEDQELLVRADATVATAEQVRNLTIRGNVEIGDVAEMYFAAEDAQSYVREGGRRVLGLGVVRQAKSNTLDISDGVSRAVARLNRRFDDVEITTIIGWAVFGGLGPRDF